MYQSYVSSHHEGCYSIFVNNSKKYELADPNTNTALGKAINEHTHTDN